MIVPTQNTEAKRHSVLQATLNLIIERGLEDTPMSLISEATGVGMSGIYRRFGNKEGLVNSLYKEITYKVVEAVTEGYDGAAPLRARFVKLWRNLAEYYLNHPKEFMFLEQYGTSPTITTETRLESLGIWESPRRMFEEAKAQEVVKDWRVQLLMHTAVAPLIMLVKGHVSKQFALEEGELDAVISACWDAVKR